VKIAVDAMGGDHAPCEILKGAVDYARKAAACQNGAAAMGPVEVLLVGDPARIEAELDEAIAHSFSLSPASADGALPRDALNLRIVPAADVIAMDEHPTQAVQEKPDSSLVVSTRLVKEGEAHAAFSAGNTGAVMFAALRLLERVPGIKRPAIATPFPTEVGGRAFVIDAGANVDCRASHLVQFALLGAVYAERVGGVERPRVGLLSNGEEASKGNELTREAHALLARSPLNFVGNVEGNHVFEGSVDVVVCDGFVGNVLLKASEGAVRLTLGLLAAEARREPDEATREVLLRSLLRIRQRVDYSEFGGAPLLGVNGVQFIAHGRSDAKTIATGIGLAVAAARTGYVEAVRDALRDHANSAAAAGAAGA
jgi:glycerol-3-phosphate acyltransferase PlsX